MLRRGRAESLFFQTIVSGRTFAHSPRNVMTHRFVAAICLLAVVATSLSTAGCGSGEYGRRLDESLKVMNRRSKFGALDVQYVRFFDGPFQVRLPNPLTKPPRPNEAKFLSISDAPGAIAIMPVAQLQPAPLELPGLQKCYQGLIIGTQRHYSVFLAAEKVTEASDQLTLDKLRDKLIASPPEGWTEDQKKQNAAAKWTTENFETVEGTNVEWQHLRMTAGGSTLYFGYAPASTYKGPLVFDIVSRKMAGYRVFLCWVVPEENVGMIDSFAKLVPGTVEVIAGAQ